MFRRSESRAACLPMPILPWGEMAVMVAMYLLLIGAAG